MGHVAETPRTLAGRYQLRAVIGRGGMGTVYEATDLILGRRVAVKILPALVADRDPANVARFEREARAAAGVNHPAVVAVYDAGADSDATTRFIVMELVDGRSLETIIRDEGPLHERRAAAIAARVADALAAAHARDLVHRDIKPANVMVASDGAVKVLDFGIARAADATGLTQSSSVLGTAAYMAPEQANGGPIDQRSDIYSLGCVLYAMLSGGPPFTGDGVAAILSQHTHAEPPAPGGGNGHVSPALSALVLRMLAKPPRDRPQSAAAVRDELLALDGEGPTAATRPLPAAGRPRRERIAVAGAFVVALVAVGIALAAMASRGQTNRHRPATTQRAGAGHRAGAARAAHHLRSRTLPAITTTTISTTITATVPPARHPLTVAQAAGALTALTTSDVQAGTIDQQAAQQISNGVSDILNSFEGGHAMDVQNQLAALEQEIGVLEQHGDITAAAAPELTRTVSRLAGALARSAPPVSGGPPGQGGGPPPGHGGEPPGQEKKHQNGQGDGGGD
jgi:serine/threonine-protein kinase